MEKKKCEHEWESIDGEEFHIRGCGETLEKSVKCKLCKCIGREIWIYSCTEEGDDGEYDSFDNKEEKEEIGRR